MLYDLIKETIHGLDCDENEGTFKISVGKEVSADDIEVKYDDDSKMITVSYSIKLEDDEESTSSFKSSCSKYIPWNINPDNITAELKSGILTIKIDKEETE